MKVAQAGRLKDLEKKNTPKKPAVANMSLDKLIRSVNHD